MDGLELREACTEAERNAALAVRRVVFIEEQGVPEALEIDAYDGDAADNALQVVAYLGGSAVATGRLLLDGPPGEYPHIGRVAVCQEWRRHGVGRAVMLALQAAAAQRGFAGITLAAQLQAIGFYERLGYVVRGDVFLDAGIEHRWMDLVL
jgi:predicted GNAT family N-acyltransferase